MLDDDSVTAELRPTRANIVCTQSISVGSHLIQRQLHQINEFVEGVQPGDHLVFFCETSLPSSMSLVRNHDSSVLSDSGHSGQVESKSMNEDDGLDEGESCMHICDFRQ